MNPSALHYSAWTVLLLYQNFLLYLSTKYDWADEVKSSK